MKKDNTVSNQGDFKLGMKKNANEEVLEISSTGYGLESVLKGSEAEDKFQQTQDDNPS